ncbi:unnamed protein product [Diatraea saccharalis]|uniref:RRM domain-containing protein n=1 Tax=Diatraea saccharalis TaxID=40085 RepID=A0A9P0C7Y5_9NEOP|nr:unnamed protein product [Diatraea saccharalis]
MRWRTSNAYNMPPTRLVVCNSAYHQRQNLPTTCKSPFFPGVEEAAGPGGAAAGSPAGPDQSQDVVTRLSAAGLSMCVSALGSPARSSPVSAGSEHGERFSRKVFVGGLPPDIDEDEITSSFRRFGPLVVDWPHKAESKSYFPPKGYAFLLFQDESSVAALMEACITDDDKLYLCVSSPTIRDKPVQIRPWKLADADFVLDASMPLDPRKTVFVGGVPRPLKAVELAMIMDRLYGGVCYAGIDTDPELKYPKVEYGNHCNVFTVVDLLIGEAVRAGRPDVRRVRGRALRLQVRAVLLRQRHVSTVLLRALLGDDPLSSRARVPQAPGEGGRRPPARRALPLVLVRLHYTIHYASGDARLVDGDTLPVAGMHYWTRGIDD